MTERRREAGGQALAGRILRLNGLLSSIPMDISGAGDVVETILLFLLETCCQAVSYVILSTVVNAGAKLRFQGQQSNYRGNLIREQDS